MRNILIIAVLVLILDQLSKYAILHVLDLDRKRVIYVFDPYLNFKMAWNQGVNFGLFASSAEVMRWVLSGLALAISGWVLHWLNSCPQRFLAQLSGGLLIGGAIGNALDRVIYGAVADFLNMSLPGWPNPFSFNVADVAIFAGAIGLVMFASTKKTP